MTLIQALGPKSYVVAPDDAYFGTTKLLRDIFGPWSVELSVVDMTELGAVESAMRPTTRLVWMETPSNPFLRVTDIAAVATIARRHGALSAVDNTWGTPVLQRPLELGADVVMHSTTKYLGGHSDVLGGALICKTDNDLAQQIRSLQSTGGAVPSPFECWLTVRGIRTLPLRIRAQSTSAAKLAAYLASHRAVEAVHYPGLPRHPGHPIAPTQMPDFGALPSRQLRNNPAAARM